MMRKRIFIDTSGFYSLLIKKDNAHNMAVKMLRKASKEKICFVTTDYVLDETTTLLKVRGHKHLIREFLENTFSSNVCSIEWMDASRFDDTKKLFLKYSDHAWSFTDCFSFVIMRELNLTKALSKDKHFSEAGTQPLLA